MATVRVDFALVGTGVAPLAAAAQLIGQGRSVVVLNPDWGFFQEDSELPLTPLLMSDSPVRASDVQRQSPEEVLARLRPDYPGAIEFSDDTGTRSSSEGFKDPLAPHVRGRHLLWMGPPTLGEEGADAQWARIEELYVEASDAGLNPKLLDGILAFARLPGAAASRPPLRAEYSRALSIAQGADVDLSRYRNGLLEYVSERLGPESLHSGVTRVERAPGGVRFHVGGKPHALEINEGTLVFWTPKLAPWVKSLGEGPVACAPRGVRYWEHWSLISRDPLPGDTIAFVGGMAVWAEDTHRLAVLRASETEWGSRESFESLSLLCRDHLRWERFSIRALRPRAVYSWAPEVLARPRHPLGGNRFWVVPGSDGPLSDVVARARAATDGAAEGVQDGVRKGAGA